MAKIDTIDISQENIKINENEIVTDTPIGVSLDDDLGDPGDYQQIKDHGTQSQGTITGYKVGDTISIDWMQSVSYYDTGYLHVDGSNYASKSYPSFGSWAESQFEYTFTTAKTYTFQVFTSSGSEGYASNVLTYVVTPALTETYSTVDVSPSTVGPGSSVTITPKVYNAEDNSEITDSSNTFNIYVNNELKGNINAGSSYSYSSTTEGSYTVYAEFIETSAYMGSVSDKKIFAITSNSNLVATSLSLVLNTTGVAPGTSVLITPNLKDKNGNTITGKSISVYEGNSKIIDNAISGSGYVYTPSGTTGSSHEIYAVFESDDDYLTSTSDSLTYTIKYSVNIDLTVEGTDYYTAGYYYHSYSGYVTDDVNFYADCGGLKPILKVYDNGDLIYDNDVTGDSDEITMVFAQNEAGEHEIYAIFEGNDTHLSARSNSVFVKVVEATSTSTEILLSSSVIKSGETILVTPRVYTGSSYNPTYIDVGTVDVYYSTSSYYSSSSANLLRTIKLGESIEYTVGDSTVYFFANYNGGSSDEAYYRPSSYTSSYAFVKPDDAEQTLTLLANGEEVESLTIDAGEKVTFSYKDLFDYDTSSSSSTKMYLYVNNVYQGVLNSPGASGTIGTLTFNENGEFDVFAAYSGYYSQYSTTYYPGINSNVIKVIVGTQTKDTTLTLTNETPINAKYGDTITITPNVAVNDDGTAVSEGDVTFSYENGTVIDTINLGQSLTLPTTLTEGTYNIKAVYNGVDGTYNPSEEATITVVISKHDVTISSFEVTSPTYPNNAVASIVTDTPGTYTVRVNGKEYTITINEGETTGSVDVDVLSAKVYSANVTFASTEKYNEAFKQTTFTVNKGTNNAELAIASETTLPGKVTIAVNNAVAGVYTVSFNDTSIADVTITVGDSDSASEEVAVPAGS